MSTKKGEFQRLPLNISPYHYNITLSLDFENFTTTGEQYVYIDVKESTNNVILNSVNIDINYAAFQNENGDTLSSKEIIFNPEEEKVTIFFQENLIVGKNGYLHFKFEGKIGDNLKGLYRSKHVGADENITYTAITQFAPTDARRCFPCWDEPIIKATFELTLEIPKAFSAISNMPLKTKIRGDKTEIYKFDKSPKMSTYLLAFVVGDFDHIESKSSDNILTKIYTPKGKSQLGNYALDVAIKVLPFYKEYFKISYPLPKIDLISVMDFAFGGMENWGLIIAREMCLLVDMENTSTTRKQRIALLVSHEIAHQWFGNLVTMKWWDDLWLNEGYASFVEFLCVNHLFPEYDIWTQFVTNTYIPALELDALKNTHPIQVPINHPSEIDEIFDAISYNKAASIIRMLHAFIGDDNFKKGMNIYLERFSYKNAETEDLWEALEEASGLPVRQIMPTWTKQKGFPILDVNHHWQDGDLILTLSQRRFFVDGTRDTENNLWVIPVQISLGITKEKIMSSVMDEKKKEIVIKNISRSTWIKVNSGTIGYYRTKYSSELLELLISAIKSRELPPLDRLGILNDTLAFARAGETTTVDVLKLLQSFQYEINATVWSSIIACFDEIGLLVNNQDFESSFKSFGRSILRTIYTKLGWDTKTDENHLDTILRPCIIEKMIFLEDEEIINEAKKKFKLHLTGKCILPPDLKNPVYKAVLLAGDNETLETMLKLYRESDLQEEKSRILKAIGTVRDEHLIIKVLDFLISPEVRSADTVLAISSVTLTQNGRFLVWEFFKKNWKLFSERYNGSYLFPNLVKYVTEHFSTEDMAREVEEFFENKSKASIERAILQGVECIRLNSAWLNRDKEAMRIFLNSQ